VHFIILDLAQSPEEVEFLTHDLAFVPKDQLVVLMMHVPLVLEKAHFFREISA
jgi:hypothetical protein